MFLSIVDNIIDDTELILEAKYGFDETNLSLYKQKTKDMSTDYKNMISTCLVPLCLIGKNTGKVYWQNGRPSSTTSCRPCYLEHAKETDDKIREKNIQLKEEIDLLQGFRIGEFFVTYRMYSTMLDGKNS